MRFPTWMMHYLSGSKRLIDANLLLYAKLQHGRELTPAECHRIRTHAWPDRLTVGDAVSRFLVHEMRSAA